MILNSNLSLNCKVCPVGGYAVIVRLKNLKNVKVMGSLWPVTYFGELFLSQRTPYSRRDRYRARHLCLSFSNFRRRLSNKIPEMFLKCMCPINFRQSYWNSSYSCSRYGRYSCRDDYVFPPCTSSQN